MKEIGIEELKRHQLEMLLKIDMFCRQNNLKYTLAYGTLIGAVRHKGYIPWDDDIDIAMPRPSYDYFIQHFNGCFEELQVFAPELDIAYYAPYANVCDKRTILKEKKLSHRGTEIGIKIDVFPIDGTPDDEIEYKELMIKCSKYREIMSDKRMLLSYQDKSLFLKLAAKKVMYSVRSFEMYQQKILDICKQNSFDNSMYVDNIAYPVYSYTRVPKYYFDSFIEVEFEGTKLLSIENYDGYLRAIYGDYMKMPPLNKRIPHHGFTAYWKD